MGLKLDEDTAGPVGQWLHDAREKRGLTQDDLRSLSGVSRATIQSIERGHPKTRSNSTITNLEKALEVPVGTIREVAAGKPVPTVPGQVVGDELAEVVRQIGELREISREQDAAWIERLDSLEQQFDSLEQRVARLEQQTDG